VNDPQIGHACGVFGVYAPGHAVAHLTYLGLYALQHRGQESAGIAVSDGQTITVSKDMGLVTQVFDERRLAPLDGHLSIGHVRYSTTGSSSWRNAQPVYRSVGDAGFALGHNGNLTNTVELAEHLGMLPGLVPGDTGLDSTTDSALVAELIAHEYAAEGRSDGRDLELALLQVLPQLAGGFSFVMMDEAHLIGVRDPHGFWPLVLGRVEGGWVLASETAALDIVGAHFVREVEPGEMIVIDASGVHTNRFAEADPKLCLFEFVYFARPDTTLYGKSVHAARQRMGEELARQAPVDADMVRAGLRAGGRHPVRRRPGEEPLRRPHVHPAEPEAARAGGAAEAQPAPREHPRQEARGGRRLHRAGHHHASGRADAARGRRVGGALPRVVAALQVAVLVRHGHRQPVGAAGGRHVGG
jgi:amidophosphoribosyltransferase